MATDEKPAKPAKPPAEKPAARARKGRPSLAEVAVEAAARRADISTTVEV